MVKMSVLPQMSDAIPNNILTGVSVFVEIDKLILKFNENTRPITVQNCPECLKT